MLGLLAGAAQRHRVIGIADEDPIAGLVACQVEPDAHDVGQSGLMTPPCGAPVTVACHAPTNTPARSQPRTSRSTRRSEIRRATRSITSWWSRESKNARIRVLPPWLVSSGLGEPGLSRG
jgi:hypothetical protein